MKIVLDTNVLVSGLLTPFGPGGTIIRMIVAGDLVLAVDARIVSEYQDVLLKPKFKFNPDHIETLIDFIKRSCQNVSTRPLKHSLPDPDDEPFLEVAIAARADSLITGNHVHFPSDLCQGIAVYSPSAFLNYYRNT
ncbi:MAG: putative toxin-antitoxin system toxin component, PIN family [Proteobacteria bacterium]|nr:putative toxin-antitoxin system toxin component, PIN family [Pseudomonadota bacterium]